MYQAIYLSIFFSIRPLIFRYKGSFTLLFSKQAVCQTYFPIFKLLRILVMVSDYLVLNVSFMDLKTFIMRSGTLQYDLRVT